MLLRKATPSETPLIWTILQDAIEQRKQDGSKQWQDGYPNEQTVRNDIQNGHAYVLTDGDTIIACAAILFDKEPAYEIIEGRWLTDGDYTTVHRVATSNAVKGKGIATRLFEMIEDLSRKHSIYSIKVDTNFDNIPMLKIVEKLGYSYCGKVYFRGSARKAFEKVLKP